MTGSMSADEVERARARFHVDQEEAEYVDYVEAMGRIGRHRYWRRRRRRFLDDRGYHVVDRDFRAGEASGG